MLSSLLCGIHAYKLLLREGAKKALWFNYAAGVNMIRFC